MLENRALHDEGCVTHYYTELAALLENRALQDEGCVTHYYIELAEEKKVFSNFVKHESVCGCPRFCCEYQKHS